MQHINDWIADAEKSVKRAHDKGKEEELVVLLKAKAHMQDKKFIKDHEWSILEVEVLNRQQFLTAKPIVYLLNMSIEEYKKKYNKYLKQIIDWVKAHGGGPIIPYSAAYEEQVVNAPDKEAFCKEEGAPSMINKIIKAGYGCLNLIHFFTTMNNDLRCWTIRAGTVAKKAAGQVHTDMEEGFVCVDVVKYVDLAELGSENEVKAAGKMKQMGKDYEVEDGEILFIKFNPSKKKK